MKDPPCLFPEASVASLPPRETPFFRLAEHSAGYLSDAELLSLLIRTSRSGGEPLQSARELLCTHGTLTSVSRLTLDELQTVRGIGPAGASAVKGAFALAARLNREKHAEGVSLESPAAVADFMRDEYRTLSAECFYALLLNTKHRLIRRELVTAGLVDRSQVHAREVFRPAIRASCSRIVVTHNHPSGDPTPSAQDISCTKNLVSAGKIVGIEVLDHVIVGQRSESRPRDYLSLREENLL